MILFSDMPKIIKRFGRPSKVININGSPLVFYIKGGFIHYHDQKRFDENRIQNEGEFYETLKVYECTKCVEKDERGILKLKTVSTEVLKFFNIEERVDIYDKNTFYINKKMSRITQLMQIAEYATNTDRYNNLAVYTCNELLYYLLPNKVINKHPKDPYLDISNFVRNNIVRELSPEAILILCHMIHYNKTNYRYNALNDVEARLINNIRLNSKTISVYSKIIDSKLKKLRNYTGSIMVREKYSLLFTALYNLLLNAEKWTRKECGQLPF